MLVQTCVQMFGFEEFGLTQFATFLGEKDLIDSLADLGRCIFQSSVRMANDDSAFGVLDAECYVGEHEFGRIVTLQGWIGGNGFVYFFFNL